MNISVPARANEALIDELHQRWMADRRSVSEDWAAFFEGFELGLGRAGNLEQTEAVVSASPLQTRIDDLVDAYRTLGHTVAHLDPLSPSAPSNPQLDLDQFGLASANMDEIVSSRYFRKGAAMPLRQMIDELRRTYCGTLGAEFEHIQNPVIREWVVERLENRPAPDRNDPALHRSVLETLYEAETFESFIHAKYVGQKRFSLEGGESLMVALKTILDSCPAAGVKEIVMGMAHRGRLNVLSNFLKKPASVIFGEFQDFFNPDKHGGGENGDVKYHLGYQNTLDLPGGHSLEIRMAANPSHLEAVDPVVQGKARARQRVLGDTEHRKAVVPLLIHGDAAFIGQGVVAETFNMSQLPGYSTGGTIHIVVNNQIGFTTLPVDARSTAYCTDIAKIVDAPVFHVNGEDPLTVLEVARIAFDFRQSFGRDVVIDIYGYRRHGHNETDEPSFTQPDIYHVIKKHPLPGIRFAAELAALGTVTPAEAEALRAACIARLDKELAQAAKEIAALKKKSAFRGSTAIHQAPYSHDPVNTAISKNKLDRIVKAITTIPDGFHIVQKIQRTVIDRRLQVWKDGGPYDWGFAEALAFGSLLVEGTPVRLSGQDSRRGTFSHRNAVLYDEKSREPYIPLKHIAPKQESFCIYNSPLSEYAVLGFDYGYSMDYPSMLCIWEAQFGDFSNGAQIIIDQFIASAEAKWRRPSSIVMLLPHGYEGQGPEHSSARLERFLQLCAQENMQVCNPTTPAQYFHVLRRQIHRAYRKPLVIMTPKSLLRSEDSVSRTEDFTNARFEEILDDPSIADPSAVTRIVYCSGKVYFDLVRARAEAGQEKTTAILRIEQLYPLHTARLKALATRYSSAKRFVWCQEEPENQGAWQFLAPRIAGIVGTLIAYAGRPESASPAVGSYGKHKEQQTALLAAAFNL
jgi:2-oxoglutarate dehydrogenase E1 component